MEIQIEDVHEYTRFHDGIVINIFTHNYFKQKHYNENGILESCEVCNY